MSKFTEQEEKLLRLFQTDENRRAEEEFARIFTERDNVRLAFINENRAFTDGRNIVVDPAQDKLFTDIQALESTAEFLGLSPVSRNPWTALKLCTRSQDIHECLHIIYTAFPSPAAYDPRSTEKARALTLSLIGNIIEDAYIEAVGASVYDNAEMYLKWGRVSRLYANTPSEGTVIRCFDEVKADKDSSQKLTYILDYMAGELLYPMMEQQPPEEDCAQYIEKVRPLFEKGAVSSTSAKRHEYSQLIFDILEELIPPSEKLIDRAVLDKMLGGTETHSPFRCDAKPFVSQGKEAAVTRRLFTDLEGNKIDGEDISGKYALLVSEAEKEYSLAKEDDSKEGITIIFSGSDFGATAIHSGMKIIENHPKPNKNMSKAYSNILNKYRSSINTYNSRFEQLLKGEREYSEDKKLFGTGISSSNLGDVKKRYWYRKTVDSGVPEMAVLFMIDGSGSMEGERRNAAVVSSVILHEVLRKQEIAHAFVEHRAIFDSPEIIHNVLVGFNGRESEKLNLMSLDSYEGTREGLSLYWAERYLSENTSAEKKLIIVISDGCPAHEYDGIEYYPPVSVMDTRNAARKITLRGTQIIALALGGNGVSCYEYLKEIYPETIDCTNLKTLTGQLLKVISRGLR